MLNFHRVNAVPKPIQMVAKYHPPTSINFKKKGFDMKKYIVEIVEKVVYKVERSAVSPECAENLVRELYDMGAFEDEGELDSVSFDVVEEKEDK